MAGIAAAVSPRHSGDQEQWVPGIAFRLPDLTENLHRAGATGRGCAGKSSKDPQRSWASRCIASTSTQGSGADWGNGDALQQLGCSRAWRRADEGVVPMAVLGCDAPTSVAG